MKYFYGIALSIFLSPLFTLAQSNYKPGYVVTTKGDTVRGFINLREWETNPRNISFKTAASGKEVRSLGVNDISFFEITNLESYQRYVGLLNDDPTSVSNVPIGRNTSTITDSVFLKIAETGDHITLYSYRDNKKEHFFIASNEDKNPVELVYRIYKNDGETFTENGYMRQLYALAIKYGNNSEALKKRIEGSDYNSFNLIDVARSINNNGSIDSHKFNSDAKGTSFFAGIGLNISNNQTDGIYTANADGVVTSTSYLPKISVGLNVLANPNVGRVVFRAEAVFTENRFKHTEQYNSILYSGYYTYGYKQYNLSIIPQLIYNFYNSDNFKFYGDVGLSLNISAYGDNESISKVDDKITQTKDVLKLMRAWTSFPFKLGFVINKKYDISVAYIKPAAFTQSDSYDAQVSSLQIGLNYSF